MSDPLDDILGKRYEIVNYRRGADGMWLAVWKHVPRMYQMLDRIFSIASTWEYDSEADNE